MIHVARQKEPLGAEPGGAGFRFFFFFAGISSPAVPTACDSVAAGKSKPLSRGARSSRSKAEVATSPHGCAKVCTPARSGAGVSAGRQRADGSCTACGRRAIDRFMGRGTAVIGANNRSLSARTRIARFHAFDKKYDCFHAHGRGWAGAFAVWQIRASCK